MKKTIIKALIVDDEAHARQLIRDVLGLFENPISIVGEAENLPNAIKLIQQHTPQVLFLDIDMPNFSGLDIKNFLPDNHNLIIVFVTAHSEYAIEAIRTSAFDYLLKPVNLKQLQDCVLRIETAFAKQQQPTRKEFKEQRIEINTLHQTHYLDSSEVFYIEASGMYSVLHTQKEQLIVSKPLKEFSFLESSGFYRIHRSYLVNTKAIVKLSKTEGTEAVLENGKTLPISRTMKEDFKTFMREQYHW
jgi:two-component system LytT family response regulator